MKTYVKWLVIACITAWSSAALSQQAQPTGNNLVVVMKTTMGTIEIELFSDRAPQTVSNFLSYVTESFYDSTLFHRVIKGFMIQGGGFTTSFQRKETKPPIKNEATNGLSNKRGTVTMARTNVIDSATSQFFINLVDNDFLDHKDNTPKGYGYCVFGNVVKGLDIVDKIASVTVRQGTISEAVPVNPVIIESVRVKE